jgi:hypothetical protein
MACDHDSGLHGVGAQRLRCTYFVTNGLIESSRLNREAFAFNATNYIEHERTRRSGAEAYRIEKTVHSTRSC